MSQGPKFWTPKNGPQVSENVQKFNSFLDEKRQKIVDWAGETIEKLIKKEDDDSQYNTFLKNEDFKDLQEFKDAIDKGAKLEFGGKLHKPNSLLFEPTILTSIKQNMLVFKNENFSPIVPILIFENDKEVVEMANYANNFGCKRK